MKMDSITSSTKERLELQECSRSADFRAVLGASVPTKMPQGAIGGPGGALGGFGCGFGWDLDGLGGLWVQIDLINFS